MESTSSGRGVHATRPGKLREGGANAPLPQTAITADCRTWSLLGVSGGTDHALGRPSSVGRSPPQAPACLDLAAAWRIQEAGSGAWRRLDRGVPTGRRSYLPGSSGVLRAPPTIHKILDHGLRLADAVLRREAESASHGGPHTPSSRAFPLETGCTISATTHRSRGAEARMSHCGSIQIFVGAVSGNRPLLDAALGTRNLQLESRYEVQHSSTALGLVAAGVAAAIVPSLAIQQESYPRIRVIGLTDPVISRTLVLVSRKASHLSPAAQALYDLIRARAGATRSGADRALQGQWFQPGQWRFKAPRGSLPRASG